MGRPIDVDPRLRIPRRFLPVVLAAKGGALIGACRSAFQHTTPTPDTFEVFGVRVTRRDIPEERKDSNTTGSVQEDRLLIQQTREVVRQTITGLLTEKYKERYPEVLFPNRGAFIVRNRRIGETTTRGFSVYDEIGIGPDSALTMRVGTNYLIITPETGERELSEVYFRTNLLYPNTYGKQIPELIAATRFQEGETYIPLERLTPALRTIFEFPPDFELSPLSEEEQKKEPLVKARGSRYLADGRRRLTVTLGSFDDLIITVIFPKG